MKAPDKICVAPHQIFDYDLEIQEVGHNGAEEYIRKEALLEWANKRLEEFRHIAEISNDVAADGEVDAFEELIDKLNEEVHVQDTVGDVVPVGNAMCRI